MIYDSKMMKSFLQSFAFSEVPAEALPAAMRAASFTAASIAASVD
jgi:hypothetical protein